ncbi:polypeptide N-acetylgalactosaminyltransferase 4-like [Branchiostoma floridae]|uniref:Polypeptide N-acetylgalactosaminyltransferase n=1 Tax=Branchiostoma floridae TaxID=7739 RepID=A0A9J7N9G3_BRAFL|nr:polypeptide N-acetylgalactosaminyltransferase 4-like [Branchiostoma floridae]
MRLRNRTRGPVRWGLACSLILTGFIIYYLHVQNSGVSSRKVNERNAQVRGSGFGVAKRGENSEGTLSYDIQDVVAGLERLSLALKILEQKNGKPINGDPSNPNIGMNELYTAKAKDTGGQRTSSLDDKLENTAVHSTTYPTRWSTTKNTHILSHVRRISTINNQTSRPRNLEESLGAGLVDNETLDYRNKKTTEPTKHLQDRTTKASVQTSRIGRKATTILVEKDDRNKPEPSAVSRGSEYLPTVHIKPPSDPNSPGEYGVAVDLVNLTEAQEKRRHELLEKYGLDEYLSRQISLHRALPYSRPDRCQKQTFLPNLPSVSIIVVFHNEAMSVLKRTLHSILDNTPSSLLQEVLLVDDLSDNEDLKGDLEDYISQLPRIRLLRNRQREGLARSRVRAAGVASGDVLTFLDSHVECNTGWLEPLVDRIARDRKTVVSPGIDWIHGDTFAYDYGIDTLRVTWGWNLGFGFDHEHAERWVQLSEDEQVKPVRSPMLLGGLFAIDRQYFREIGMYDPGLEYWGGEHFEISFKAWMCGGSIEVLPCSRVGHVWGKKTYSTGNMTLHDWASRNNMRVAEVWMDHYKVHYYIRRPYLMKRKFGDISGRRRLRERLQCKNFRWYLDNAFPDLYIPDDIPGRYGQVRNNGTNTCLDWTSKPQRELEMFPCHHGLGTQFFELTGQNQLRDERSCLQARDDGSDVMLVTCGRSEEEPPPLQQWTLTNGGFLYNAATKTCLHAVPADPGAGGKVTIMPCDLSSLQKWTIEYIWHKDLG